MVYGYVILFLFLVPVPSYGAPRSKNSRNNQPHTVYDQKQTGDYNIQLHLKDFQIIALLADDAAFGDYDYNYDYADFTAKPTSHKPSETASSTFSPSTSPASIPESPAPTLKPVNHPYPILLPPSTVQPIKEKPNPIETKPLTPVQILPTELIINEVNKINAISTNGHVAPTNGSVSSTSGPVSPTNGPETPTNAPLSPVRPTNEPGSSTTQKSQQSEDTDSPGQIKVQIIETPVRSALVPGEEVHEPHAEAGEVMSHSDVLQLRKCDLGFSRDKKGRCRRVRKPGGQSQLPFGFGRLASNLASRLRNAPRDISVLSPSESSENLKIFN